jgi:hypothetical protein
MATQDQGRNVLSKAALTGRQRHFRFALISAHQPTDPVVPFRANSGLDRAFVHILLFCDDVHALEVLRLDGFLHYARLFCFVDECLEQSLRSGRAAFRQRSRHENRRACHDLGTGKGLGGGIPDARVRAKDVRSAGAQKVGCVGRNGGT